MQNPIQSPRINSIATTLFKANLGCEYKIINATMNHQKRTQPMQWKGYLWQWALNLYEGLVAPCFVLRPETRFLHIRNDDAFISFLISIITSFSDNPNWYSIASKDVRSSHAISIMRSIEADCKSLIRMMTTFLEKIFLSRSGLRFTKLRKSHNKQFFWYEITMLV